MQGTLTQNRVEGLQTILKGTFDLYRRTHLAHFNVRGPWFPQLHSLFEEQYTELWGALDTVGERIRSLGTSVDGEAFSGGRVPEGVDAEEAVRQLAQGNRDLTKKWQEVSDAAAEAGDKATEDLAIERMRAHDQHAWMLEATLERGV